MTALFRHLMIATQFLTRLPVPLASTWSMEDLRESVAMFPLVGILVGCIGSVVYAAAAFCYLPPALAALITVAALVLATGGLHEDGLADVADGFGGGHTRQRKLDIMRDSRLGSYGAIALVLSLTLRAGAIAHLAAPGTVAAGLLIASGVSRAALPVAMLMLPQARREGLAAAAGRPRQKGVSVAVALAVSLALVMGLVALTPAAGIAAMTASLMIGGLFLLLAHRQIGGITGDVLGGLQQLVDVACLLALAAVVSGSR